MENFAPGSGTKADPMTAAARVLIIAGSDSGGGAGIQADIKTVTMLGGHAMTAVTAITAQNTLGVTAVHPVPAEIILAQIDAVVADFGVDAVKIGMIGSAFAAKQVAVRLQELKTADPDLPIVFDPVMVATSGAALADDDTVAAFGRLMDVATLATPNLPELNRLTSEEDPVAAALHLVGKHGCAVLIKGGHDEGDALADALIEEDNMTSWQGQRIDTEQTHGTGCTLASAITTLLAQGSTLADAVARGREFVRVALFEAPGLGQGSGPTRSPSPAPITSDRSISTAGSGSSRSSTARPTMRGSRPAAERPSRSRSTPKKRSLRRPASISNATTSTSAWSCSRAAASRSSTARAINRGCGARRGSATPTATSFSCTRRAKRGVFRRGGSTPLMSNDVESLLNVVSFLASIGLAIALWDRHWVYRCLPIACGVCSGFLVAVEFGHTGLELFENVAVGMALGLIFFFCAWGEVWLERRRNPQKPNANPGSSLE
jgi:hydroxymethylpyrimidine kinase/phosphomethylpyrimidine kinase